MLAHVAVAAHAGIATAVELFCVRERSFNRLFAPCVEIFTCRRFRECICLIQIVLPNMPRHLLSLVALGKAFRSSGAGLTRFFVATVLAEPFAVRGGVFEQTTFRADIAVQCGIVSKPIFAICAVRVGVSAIS